MKQLMHIVIATLLVTMSYGALAGAILQPGELERLPQYCQAKMVKGHPARQAWSKRLGSKNFVHVHHYCYALALDARSFRAASRKDRVFLMQRAAANYDYVITRFDPTVVLLPEAHYKKGKLLERMDREGESVAHYQRAIELNPKYPPGYAGLSDLYIKLGRKEEAHEVLERGMAANPNSRMLTKRISKLQRKQ